MYPWVNRLHKPLDEVVPSFYDDNGLPIHGLYAAEERVKVNGGEDWVTVVPLK